MKVFQCLILVLTSIISNAQLFQYKNEYTKQDSLRGTNNKYRDWWDVKQYNLMVKPLFDDKIISGVNIITFKVDSLIANEKIMQIDLQKPMQLEKAILENKEITFKREGDFYFLDFDKINFDRKEYKLELHYKGKPREAKNAPWDGGWIFKYDEKERPWMSVACQGLGASVWYPNKDYLGDEPDNGAIFTIETEDDLVAVGNGRLVKQKENSYTWKVVNPINNYNIVPYVGYYKNFKDKYQGEKGKLDLDYWVIDYNLEKAKKHFKQVKPMIKAFENWFGPYPFYKDSYKLVEAPHLGMEHQSNVAYGNGYQNGYKGNDLSGTGRGLDWDFIIIHESGHEWFGNNITNKDIADMWIHESFTAYSEVLFIESIHGKEAGSDYVIGTRMATQNDIPIIGPYEVHKEGSGDMYYKGANMLHAIRQIINDDVLFKQILRGLNKVFYHKTVKTKDIEDYINTKSGKDFSKVFDQYLRTINVPILEYYIEKDKFNYRWSNTIKDFDMPIRLSNSDKWLNPTQKWQKLDLKKLSMNSLGIDRNFYIDVKKVK